MSLADTEANTDARDMELERLADLPPEQRAADAEAFADWLRAEHPDVYYAVASSAPTADTWGDDELPPDIDWLRDADAVSDAGDGLGRAA